MKKSFLSIILTAAITLTTAVSFVGCGNSSSGSSSSSDNSSAEKVTITNVSYDPTRELYEAYNKIFADHWKEEKGQEVEITHSHGGSGWTIVNKVDRKNRKIK